MSVIFSIRLDEATAVALRRKAQDQGVSVSEILREAATRTLQNEGEAVATREELLRRLVRLEAQLMKAGAQKELFVWLEPCFRQLNEMIDLLRNDLPGLQKKCA